MAFILYFQIMRSPCLTCKSNVVLIKILSSFSSSLIRAYPDFQWSPFEHLVVSEFWLVCLKFDKPKRFVNFFDRDSILARSAWLAVG